MKNNLIGVIVGIIVTLIIALYAGVSTAEGSTTPMIIIGAIAGLIIMVSLKDKVWMLLVAAPFLTLKMPGALGKFVFFEVALAIVLPFYLFNIFFKRTRPTWNRNKYLDFFIALFGILTIALLIRFPFGLLVLSDAGAEYINSKAYVHIGLGLVFYVAVSTIKTNHKTLIKTALICVFVSLAAALLQAVLKGQRYDIEGGALTQGRFGAFLSLGLWLTLFSLCRCGLFEMLRKPWYAISFLVGSVFVTLSGFRSRLAMIGLYFIATCIVRRRYMEMLVAPGIGFFFFFIFVGAFGATKLPYGIQRAISFIPIIEVKEDIRTGAEASSEWRFQMWEWAMDPSKDYIHDRIWGDGFAQEKEEFTRLNRETVISRNKSNKEIFASRGLWHSGPISTIHRYGFVGLGIALLILLGNTYYGMIACKIYYRQKYGWAVLFVLIPRVVELFFWTLVFGDIGSFYLVINSSVLIKLFLYTAQKDGLYVPVSVKEEYVPLMIRKARQESTEQMGIPFSTQGNSLTAAKGK